MRIPCRKPYTWLELLDFLAPRAIDGIEEVKNGVYRRTVCLNLEGVTYTGWTAVSYNENDSVLNAEISLSLAPVLEYVVDRIKRMFDVDTRPEDVASVLGEMTNICPGRRIPGCFDAFEMAVRAILGQQITVKAAHTLVTRIVETLGSRIESPFPELYRIFPSPHDLLETDGETLGRLGIIRNRQRALYALAEFAISGGLEPRTGIEEQIADMKKLPGIGVWTAHYVAMRAFSWKDAFPHTDYAVKTAMGNISPAEIIRLAERWRPWRAYATMYLWRGHREKEKKQAKL
jgi:AraC family transcriptional regulator of adaptative response / DNA-3-methyladenine glycosylase II